MKKSLLAAAICALTLTLPSVSAFAAPDSDVKFKSDSTLVYTGSEVSKTVAPGETFTEEISLSNENSTTADFYMNTEVIKELEKAGAAGAGYDVKISVKKGSDTTSLYDSTLGGDGSTTGLSGMNDSLKSDILVSTLKKGENASIIVEIFFDGEGLDNTALANYANTLANLNFDFKVGYEAPTGTSTVYKVVDKKGKVQYLTVTGAQTGDSLWVPFVIGGVLILGAVLLFLGKKKKNVAKVTTAAFIFALAALSFGTDAKASETENKTYTITFRPGKSGSFDISDNDAVIAMYGENAKMTELGAIKITVKPGADMPQTPSVIPGEGYVEKTGWASNEKKVTKSEDFVADYAKEVNGVEYTIKYVEKATGNSIRPSETKRGNVGDEVNPQAPVVITLSDAARFNIVGTNADYVRKLTKDDVTDNDLTENVIEVYYVMEARTTNTVTTENLIPGDVITTVVNAPAAAVPAAQAQAPVAAAEEVAAPEETAEEAGDEINIEDENTALASAPASEDLTIEDEGTPLSETMGSAPVWPYIVAAGVVVLAILALFVVNMRKKKNSQEDNKTA